MSHSRFKVLSLVPALLFVVACNDGSSSGTDTSTDTGVDPDVVTDTLTDTVADTLIDTTPVDTVDDNPADTPTDLVEDGDAVEDVETDVPADIPDDVHGDSPADVHGDGDVLDEDAVACLPAWGIINEFVPDEHGAEGSSDETFIEIRTEAGVDLTGAVIECVNGDGGTVYLTVDLAGTVDTDGFFVVGEDAAIANTDQVLNNLNGLQNGPDGLILRDSCGTILDAVGYGAFGVSDVFSGEGTPVAVGGEGTSLGRCPGAPASVDTDDNSADFVTIAVPTPGEANPACD